MRRLRRPDAPRPGGPRRGRAHGACAAGVFVSSRQRRGRVRQRQRRLAAGRAPAPAPAPEPDTAWGSYGQRPDGGSAGPGRSVPPRAPLPVLCGQWWTGGGRLRAAGGAYDAWGTGPAGRRHRTGRVGESAVPYAAAGTGRRARTVRPAARVSAPAAVK